jgi:hypothetical protein
MNPSDPVFLSLTAAGSALAGSLFGIIGNAVIEWRKHVRSRADQRRSRAIDECEMFLAEVEQTMKTAWAHYEETGLLPGSLGYEQETAGKAERMLLLELHCPPRILKSAHALVEAADSWAFIESKSLSTGWAAYEDARKTFITEFRRMAGLTRTQSATKL